MDDVDAVQAQIALNMLKSGDWVTARLNGVAYLEKPPLVYWMMATSMGVFGHHDWAARLPLALASVALCLATFAFMRWAHQDVLPATYSGLILSTCIGLFLFTRILIPDATLTLFLLVSLWALLRLVEAQEPRPRLWACILGFSLGCGLLLKGLIAIVFPALAFAIYLALDRRLWSRATLRSLNLPLVVSVMLLVAAPWHVLATLRNPPYFFFSLQSGPGQYHGFFWFYFINEQLLRFLNRRYPRDYNTVPRALFWALNLVWLFPWSAYIAGVGRLSFSRETRIGRTHRLAAIYIASVLVFFTFSTTQEYYSMPIYPAVAMLLGSAVAAGGSSVRRGNYALVFVFSVFALIATVLLIRVWQIPAPLDISAALSRNPELYTLSLGHMMDLTTGAFAYLKLPLALAAAAFAVGAFALVGLRDRMRASVTVLASVMVVFFGAARIALARFDPYLGSYALAAASQELPPGALIAGDAYYAFSSFYFYTQKSALLWNGRYNNLEYGSYAPGAPAVFIGDEELSRAWKSPDRVYLLVYGSDLPHLDALFGDDHLHVISRSADNYLLSNHALQ